MTTLALQVLGAFGVRRDGVPITQFRSDKVRALLVYLAAEAERPHSRTSLAELLWPEQPARLTMNNLSQTLGRLREAIGDADADPPFLLISRHQVQWNPANPPQLDLTAFLRLASSTDTAELQQAAALFNGSLLPGFFVPQCQEFDEWLTLRREQCEQLALDVFDTLAKAYLEAGAFPAAEAMARRQLALDPWRESAHRQAMQALVGSGQRNAALAQYAACRRTLEQELDVEPEAATTALYEQIRAGELDPPAERPVLAQLAARVPQPLALPVPSTALLGRAGELAELKRRLSEPECRLVTVYGPGGVGKTRLALEAAAMLAERCAIDAVFVALAPVRDPELVLNAIAQALGLREAAEQPLFDRIQDALGATQLLLVLDNFEHVIAAAPGLKQLLEAAPRLTMLVTSREALRLPGEHLFQVSPLALPMPSAAAADDDPEGNPAVALFIERARQAKPDVVLTAEHAATVGEICRRVDGLPLAIELAAAHCRLLPPHAILARLDRRLPLLAGGPRDLPARHQTLRAAISWSYELLSDDERRLFRRLAVFAGGATLPAAEAVCTELRIENAELRNRQLGTEQQGSAANHQDSFLNSQFSILNSLEGLLDKSLISQQSEPAWDGPRVVMLETIREYALEQLAAAGEETLIRRRHARFFLDVAETSEPAIQGADQRAWLDRLEREHDNIRTALRWSLEQGDAEIGVRLAAALAEFWWPRGYLSEGRQWLAKALERMRAPEVPRSARAKALYHAGLLSYASGDMAAAVSLLEQSLALYSELGDERGLACVLRASAATADMQGATKEAAALGEQSLALFRAVGDDWGIAWMLHHSAARQPDVAHKTALLEQSLTVAQHGGYKRVSVTVLGDLAGLALVAGDHGQAAQLYEQGLQLCHELDDRWISARMLAGLGMIARDRADYERATAYFGESLAAHRRVGNGAGIAALLGHLGDVARWQGDYEHAGALYAESLRRYEALNHTRGRAGLLYQHGYLALARHTYDEARDWFVQSLRVLYRHQPAPSSADTLPAMAGLGVATARRGELGEAARLFGIVETLAGDTAPNYNLAPADYAEVHSAMAGTWATLDRAAVREAWLAGRAQPPERVVAFVLDQMIAAELAQPPDLAEQSQDAIAGSAHEQATGPVIEDGLPEHAGLVPASRQRDWDEAPDLGPFYGREHELATVMRWLLEDGCRVVAVIGLGGVGKTALAAQAMQQAAGRFDTVIWRSLLNAPPLGELLRAMLGTLSDHQAALPATPSEQRDLLLDLLRRRRCLIVLDNLESIVQGGDPTLPYREGYAEYGRLLQRLGQTRHQSCVLLTSREEPPELARLAAEAGTQHGAVRVLSIGGLHDAAAQAILELHGVGGADTAPLVQTYGGHPLALKLVADTIRDLYGGEIAAFLGEDTPIFGDIRVVLDQQWARLGQLEQEMLVCLAVAREPMTIAAIQATLLGVSGRGALLEAVRSLRQRSLLELHGDGLALQNVVIEYVTDRLIAQAFRELSGGALDWLNRVALQHTGAKEYVRHSQQRLIVQPLAQRIVHTLGERGVRERWVQLLDELRREPRTPGYAAGNLLTLLLALGFPLRGYDFAQLCVWQADLRNAEAQEVSFAGSDLASTRFTDTFASITGLQFTPDGERVLAACADGTLRLWSVRDGRPLGVFDGHAGVVWSVAVSPDGRLCASGGDDQTVRVWSIDDGQTVYVLRGHTFAVQSVAFSPDGTLLASGGRDHTVRIWDISTGTLANTLQGHDSTVYTLAFAPTGAGRPLLASGGSAPLLTSGSAAPLIYLWDVTDARLMRTLSSPDGQVRRLAWSPDGATLLSSGNELAMRLWDTATWQSRGVLSGHTKNVESVAFSPDSATIVSSGFDDTVRLWDARSGQIKRVLHGHTGWIHAVAFSPDGVTAASGGADQSVRIWDTRSGHELHTFAGHTHWIPALAFAPDGEALVSGHWDHAVRVWSLHDGVLLHTFHGHSKFVTCVAWSPDGMRVASGSSDGTVRLWSLQAGQRHHVLQNHTASIVDVAFHPHGHLLASCQEGNIRVWDARTGHLVYTLAEPGEWVAAFAFDPDGRTLVAGTENCTIQIWAVDGWQRIGLIEAPASRGQLWKVALNHAGTCLAVGYYEGIIDLWDVATRTVRHRLHGHTNVIEALAWTPDDALLVSGSDDTTIRVWDAATGEQQRAWQGHPIRTMALAVRPRPANPGAAPVLASGGCDDAIKLWDIDTAACVQTLRAAGPYAGMNITAAGGLNPTQRQAIIALGGFEEPAAREV